MLEQVETHWNAGTSRDTLESLWYGTVLKDVLYDTIYLIHVVFHFISEELLEQISYLS
jgi:hypothetical protein